MKQQYISEEPELPSGETVNAARPWSAAQREEVAHEASAPASNVRPFTKVPARTIEPEVEEVTPLVVERRDMVKGYEFEKGKFVLFTTDELKALEEGARQTIDIVAFIPQETVDPIYYDKAYFLAPDKRGNKPYSLLHEAMCSSGRCA